MREQVNLKPPTTNTGSIITKIYNHTLSMGKVFSDQKITILRGNGFYYKYIPATLKSGGTGDDDYISTTLDNTQFVVIFCYFQKLANDKYGIVTGTTYVMTPNNNTFDVTIKKSKYYGSTSKLTVN
jgi:hypothetical protein